MTKRGRITGIVNFHQLSAELAEKYKVKWRCTIGAYSKDKEAGLSVGDMFGVGWGKTKRGALTAAQRYMRQNASVAYTAIHKAKAEL